MTTLLKRTDPWTVQPGWGIVVDLTPPELLNARLLRSVRRAVVGALVAVLVLCASWYVMALRDRSAAEDDLANAQLVTTQVQRSTQTYAGVTQIEGAAAHIRAEIGQLMKTDAKLDKLARQLSAALPTGASYSNLAVTIDGVGVTGQSAAGEASVTPDGTHQKVGNVKISGTARSVDDVSLLVERLQAVPGLVDVVPTSNTKQDHGVNFQISLGLDDRVLSHRFDVKAGN